MIPAKVVSMVDKEFGNWLAGFIDGEGSFYIARHGSRSVYRPRFSLSVRSDDRPVIDEIHQRTQLGTVHEYKASTGSMITRWDVQSRESCAALVVLLTKYPLRAKKKRDFEVWRRAVAIQDTIRSGRADNSSVSASMLALKEELAHVREGLITW
jgi:hypothetical protein